MFDFYQFHCVNRENCAKMWFKIKTRLSGIEPKNVLVTAHHTYYRANDDLPQTYSNLLTYLP